MEELFKDYLFTKHILVAEKEPEAEESFSALVTLENKLGINVVKGKKYASAELIEYADNQLGGYNVPEPFYRGFPESVRTLTKDQLLFDQLFHYFKTYGCGEFDEAGHSMFEDDFKRLAFNEDVGLKDFEILSEEDAVAQIKRIIGELLAETRPLSGNDYNIVREGIKAFLGFKIKEISCKQTAVHLIYDLKNLYLCKFISLADVIKLVDYINFSEYGNINLKKLNLRNKDRRFISLVIDKCLEREHVNVSECFEKRKIWCGLLHHIHYHPKNGAAIGFAEAIRNGKNISVYSKMEEAIREGNIVEAAKILSMMKGSSVVIRNLNYLLSRCKTEDEVKGVLSWVK